MATLFTLKIFKIIPRWKFMWNKNLLCIYNIRFEQKLLIYFVNRIAITLNLQILIECKK